MISNFSKQKLQYLILILFAAIIWICLQTICRSKENTVFFNLKLFRGQETDVEEYREDFVFECDDGRKGLPFNATFSKYLKEFRLLPDYKPKSYANLTEIPVFLTAFSDNHAHEGFELIAQIAKYFPTKKLILYDIGLKNEHVKTIQNKTHVLLKKFNFSAYPSDVQNLIEYRWKPLIIAQELVEHPALLWMDTSVYFEKGNISELLTRVKNNEIFPWTIMDIAGHSTFAATTKGMIDFLNCSNEILYDMQLSANFMLIYRTEKIIRNVLKWWVLCALEKECMAPKGAELYCSFAKDRFKTYGKCHRYDQSAINILLAKGTEFRGYQNYFHNPSFARIYRRA